MDVEPDHDVEPALTLFSHVRPFRQDSHNTEGRDDRMAKKNIIQTIWIASTSIPIVHSHSHGSLHPHAVLEGPP